MKQKQMILAVVMFSVFSIVAFSAHASAATKKTTWKDYFSWNEAKMIKKLSSDFVRERLESGNGDWKKIISGNSIDNNSIGENKLRNGAVSSEKLANDAVTADKIKDGTIISEDIEDNGIATIDLENNAVTSAKIADGTVLSEDIEDNGIATVDLEDGAVTVAKMSSNSCTNGQVLKFNGTAWACAADNDGGTSENINFSSGAYMSSANDHTFSFVRPGGSGQVILNAATSEAASADLVLNAGGGTVYLGDSNTNGVVISKVMTAQELAGFNAGLRVYYGEITALDVNSSTGNVGIGTTSPTEKIEVIGEAKIDGLRIGQGDGDFNTNTVLGASAFNSNVSGEKNTVNGFEALYNAASGNSNTAIGHRALYSNTTGDDNTASGDRALTSNTTGSSNVAYGVSALTSNTVGTVNTAIGTSALYSNVDGFDNTALGHLALFSNTGGTANTAEGKDALYNNTTGTSNTVNGNEALFGNTTGSQNVAIGRQAGMTDASDNYIQTSNGGVYLGYATRALAEGGTNEIVIGSTATGLGSNSAVLGNDSIVKTVLKGSIGIGTTSPSGVLDVTSTTKGVVIPRMTKVQRDAISSPVAGTMVYQTDNTPGLRMYNGTNWMRFTETVD